jgi:hypothetical protein
MYISPKKLYMLAMEKNTGTFVPPFAEPRLQVLGERTRNGMDRPYSCA